MKTTSLLPAFQSNIAKSLVLSFIVTLPLKSQVKDQYLHVLSPWDKEFVEETIPVILDADKRDIQPPNDLVLEWGDISLSRIDSLTNHYISRRVQDNDGRIFWGDTGAPKNLNLEFCLIKKPRNSSSTNGNNFASHTKGVNGNIDFDVIGVYYRFNDTKWTYLRVGTVIPPYPLYFNHIGEDECDEPQLYRTWASDRERHFENLYVFNLLYTSGYFGFRDGSKIWLGLYETIVSENKVDRTYDYSLKFNEEIVKELTSSKFFNLASQCYNSYNTTIEQLFDNPISVGWNGRPTSYYSYEKNKNILNISGYVPHWKFCDDPPFMALPIIGKLDSLVYGHLVVYPPYGNINYGKDFFTVVLNPYSHSYMDYPIQKAVRLDDYFRYFFFQDILYPSIHDKESVEKERSFYYEKKNKNDSLVAIEISSSIDSVREYTDRTIELILFEAEKEIMKNSAVGLIAKSPCQIGVGREHCLEIFTPHDLCSKYRYQMDGFVNQYPSDIFLDSLISYYNSYAEYCINRISDAYGSYLFDKYEGKISDAISDSRAQVEWAGPQITIDEIVSEIPAVAALQKDLYKLYARIKKGYLEYTRSRYYSPREINELFTYWIDRGELNYRNVKRKMVGVEPLNIRKLTNGFYLNDMQFEDRIVLEGQYAIDITFFKDKKRTPELTYGGKPISRENYPVIFKSDKIVCFPEFKQKR